MTYPLVALTYAATLPTMIVLHFAADFLLQFDPIARGKRRENEPDTSARWCALHVLIHTLTQAAGLLALWGFVDLSYAPAWAVGGLAFNGVAHFWADRRTQFLKVMRATGHAGFLDRYGDAARHALDQVFHVMCLFPAALLIVQH
ncbi:DUF3307 domain-containing protein [Spirillospora sp. NPDC127200]